jgi:hypothetical protein
MASIASQLIEEVTAHAQRVNLEDAQEICAEYTFRITFLYTVMKEDIAIFYHFGQEPEH